ncbi:MAG: type IX secretion system membrane protein PorP/SprF, partial [Bacteroidota bacterium]
MKNITRPIVIFTLFISFLGELKAQDPRFSQYYASPWNLNPAMTGLFNGSWRITGNYRDQWGSFLA